MFLICIASPQKGIKKDISVLFAIFSYSGMKERRIALLLIPYGLWLRAW